MWGSVALQTESSDSLACPLNTQRRICSGIILISLRFSAGQRSVRIYIPQNALSVLS